MKSIEVNSSKGSKGWSYSSTSQKLGTKILPSSAYYPPSCSGYDMAYCKYTDTLYIYGGIACSSSLQDGIKQYSYKLSEGKWSEVKPESTYHVMDILLHHIIEMLFYLEGYHNTNKN